MNSLTTLLDICLVSHLKDNRKTTVGDITLMVQHVNFENSRYTDLLRYRKILEPAAFALLSDKIIAYWKKYVAFDFETSLSLYDALRLAPESGLAIFDTAKTILLKTSDEEILFIYKNSQNPINFANKLLRMSAIRDVPNSIKSDMIIKKLNKC